MNAPLVRSNAQQQKLKQKIISEDKREKEEFIKKLTSQKHDHRTNFDSHFNTLTQNNLTATRLRVKQQKNKMEEPWFQALTVNFESEFNKKSKENSRQSTPKKERSPSQSNSQQQQISKADYISSIFRKKKPKNLEFDEKQIFQSQKRKVIMEENKSKFRQDEINKQFLRQDDYQRVLSKRKITGPSTKKFWKETKEAGLNSVFYAKVRELYKRKIHLAIQSGQFKMLQLTGDHKVKNIKQYISSGPKKQNNETIITKIKEQTIQNRETERENSNQGSCERSQSQNQFYQLENQKDSINNATNTCFSPIQITKSCVFQNRNPHNSSISQQQQSTSQQQSIQQQNSKQFDHKSNRIIKFKSVQESPNNVQKYSTNLKKKNIEISKLNFDKLFNHSNFPVEGSLDLENQQSSQRDTSNFYCLNSPQSSQRNNPSYLFKEQKQTHKKNFKSATDRELNIYSQNSVKDQENKNNNFYGQLTQRSIFSQKNSQYSQQQSQQLSQQYKQPYTPQHSTRRQYLNQYQQQNSISYSQFLQKDKNQIQQGQNSKKNSIHNSNTNIKLQIQQKNPFQQQQLQKQKMKNLKATHRKQVKTGQRIQSAHSIMQSPQRNSNFQDQLNENIQYIFQNQKITSKNNYILNNEND